MNYCGLWCYSILFRIEFIEFRLVKSALCDICFIFSMFEYLVIIFLDRYIKPLMSVIHGATYVRI